MPVIERLDLGPSNPWKLPKVGLHTSVVEIPGGYAIPYGVDSTHPSWRLVFKYQARNSVGAYAALSQNAMEYLGRQLEELSRNFDLQPCYLQLFAGTGLVGGAIGQPQDGWYYITSCEVNYTEPWTGVGTVTMDVELAGPGAPRRIGMWSSGGSLTSNFSVGGTSWLAFPKNSTTFGSSTGNRTGGEGAIPVSISPVANPNPYVASATIADWWLGGCRVYDAMAAIGSNGVPAAPTVLNTNWVEVLGTDHRFVGDIVITNGLLLLTFAIGGSPGVTCYLWSTSLATPGWQQFSTLNYKDDAGNTDSLQQVSLTRVGLEEVGLQSVHNSTAGALAKLTFRLQRGAYFCSTDFTPLSEANTQGNSLRLTYPANPKIVYNNGALTDNLIAGVSPALQTDYGYAVAFINSATYPFLAGWFYQNQPASQPMINANTNIGLGDTSGPAINATRHYAIFAIPYGSVSGATTVDKLQSEAESGTLGTGWSSVVDAAASGGNIAKCVSGTLTGNSDIWGTAFIPVAGLYDLWVRMKVTSAAGNTIEMRISLYNSDTTTSVASTDYKPNQVTTSYVWYRAATAVTPTAGNNMRVRALTQATLGTDWFIDEAALVPVGNDAASIWPRNLWKQWIYERTTKQVLG